MLVDVTRCMVAPASATRLGQLRHRLRTRCFEHAQHRGGQRRIQRVRAHVEREGGEQGDPPPGNLGGRGVAVVVVVVAEQGGDHPGVELVVAEQDDVRNGEQRWRAPARPAGAEAQGAQPVHVAGRVRAAHGSRCTSAVSPANKARTSNEEAAGTPARWAWRSATGTRARPTCKRHASSSRTLTRAARARHARQHVARRRCSRPTTGPTLSRVGRPSFEHATQGVVVAKPAHRQQREVLHHVRPPAPEHQPNLGERRE